MKNKRGFTLVELLAVIAILSIIMVITIPRVINQINTKKISLLEVNKGLIIAAARNYVLDYGKEIPTIIMLSELCDSNYVVCPIENPVTKTNMNGYVNVDSDKIYTYLEITSYTLTVNPNGGVWSGTTPQTIISGNTVTLETPTRTNYNFTGWTVSGEGSSISGTTFTMGTANTTISANWVQSYTCSINGTPLYTCSSGTLSGTRCDLGVPTIPAVSITSTWQRLYISSTCNVSSCQYADCNSYGGGVFTCSGSPTYQIGITASAWVTGSAPNYCRCNCNMVGSCTVTWSCTTGDLDTGRCYVNASLSGYTCPNGGALVGDMCYLYNQTSCNSGWTQS